MRAMKKQVVNVHSHVSELSKPIVAIGRFLRFHNQEIVAPTDLPRRIIVTYAGL